MADYGLEDRASDGRRSMTDAWEEITGQTKRRRQKCIIEGCEKMCPGNREKMCWPHVHRLLRYGDPLAGPPIVILGEGQRFLEKIATTVDLPTECIFWPFGKGGRRGSVWFQGRTTTPAQAMCIRIHGPMPHPLWGALHSCGNGHRSCIHPGHISWGSRTKNFQDAVGHGTAAIGNRHPNAKLSPAQAFAIRNYRGPKTAVELAREYGVTPSTVRDIKIGKSWKFLKESEDGTAYLGL
jgi:hypothetical protein